MAAEKNFEDRVKAYLKECGCYVLKYWGGAAFTKSGVPDLLICAAGQFIGIELKAEKGEPSLLQLVQLQRIRDSGGYGILLYPKEYTWFQKWLSDKRRYKTFYLHNIDLQKEWKQKLQERSNKDGSKKGTA